MDKSKYLASLNHIFSSSLSVSIRNKVSEEIKKQDEFIHCFELFYLFDSFQQMMKEQFFTKLKISKKEDLSDLTVLSFLADWKNRSLHRMAETSDVYLSKIRIINNTAATTV
jgi:hypothetical protein